MVEALRLGTDRLEDLVYERDGHVAVVTLDRPAKGNSLTAAMHAGLRAVWEDVRDDPIVRVAVLTAKGERHFCTGADVAALAERGTVSAGSGRHDEELFWTSRQNRVAKPVICAVNGLVAGAGLQFVVDADIILASPEAAFTDTHVNVGMVGGLENVGLARRMPLGAALRMTLVGREYRMPARRAYQLGLVDEIVAQADLLGSAMEMARLIARNSPAAVSLSKEAIWSSLETSYEAAVEHAWDLVRRHRSHPDAAEGPRAFVEKRRPDWAAPEDGGRP